HLVDRHLLADPTDAVIAPGKPALEGALLAHGQRLRQLILDPEAVLGMNALKKGRVAVRNTSQKAAGIGGDEETVLQQVPFPDERLGKFEGHLKSLFTAQK